jgi:hypothetical protein
LKDAVEAFGKVNKENNMSRQNLVRFNAAGLDPLTPFKVKVSGSFTIPESKTLASPVHASFGGALLGSIIPTVGGQLLLATNDGTDVITNVFDLTMHDICDLRPGDVVAMSAVVSNVVTLTVTSVDGTVRTFLISGVTTTAVVVGFYA